MHNFKDLKVWQKSIELAVEVYKAVSTLPADEKFGLISQMKRCSVSISSNIAEGCGRGSSAQFKYFLNISQGSAFELETQLIISNQLKLLNDEQSADLIQRTIEIQKMVHALSKSMNV
ncbi:four helix bundle protein [Pedobacter yonginense]|uniref:Four helix bundle protein n=1 Tax=Pedobacter yonginense TaxID=651869 RepID=A0A317EKT9_9SPHI|nr:four helix bundle protein [Pedobacter yonginense]PWS27451.1 four helix bundle protein [Pedobacter yonginense]